VTTSKLAAGRVHRKPERSATAGVFRRFDFVFVFRPISLSEPNKLAAGGDIGRISRITASRIGDVPQFDQPAWVIGPRGCGTTCFAAVRTSPARHVRTRIECGWKQVKKRQKRLYLTNFWGPSRDGGAGRTPKSDAGGAGGQSPILAAEGDSLERQTEAKNVRFDPKLGSQWQGHCSQSWPNNVFKSPSGDALTRAIRGSPKGSLFCESSPFSKKLAEKIRKSILAVAAIGPFVNGSVVRPEQQQSIAPSVVAISRIA